ncbi:MAG: hypothetical protein NVSMB56_04680 [Pyrinomonadaceae bacterium]
MTKNQKILAGCGGAGCLGIIVLAIVLIVFGSIFKSIYDKAAEQANRNQPIILRNSNGNVAARNSTTNRNSATTSRATNGDLSDDEKHRLFQAASTANDSDLMAKVLKEIGLYQNNDKGQEFALAHVRWLFSNTDFVKEMSDKDKARAYVNNYFSTH